MTDLKTAEIYVCPLYRSYRYHMGPLSSANTWKTFRGAIAAAERRGYTVTNKDVDPMPAFLADDKRTKIVTNLLSGKLVRIGENTPLCCDPSSETYWSM